MTNRPKCRYSINAVETDTGAQITIDITPHDGDKHKAIAMADMFMKVLDALAVTAVRIDLEREWSDGDRPTE